MTSIKNEKLRSLVERIERLNDDKADILRDIKDVYLEAKAVGYDVKIIRKIIADRAKDPAKREEEQALYDLYMDALANTPIEKYIKEQAA